MKSPKINLIIFDLDGVLLDKSIHFKALNKALKTNTDIIITEEEHEKYYDGRPTIQKLKLLENNKGLDSKIFDKIWQSKQFWTRQLLEELKPNHKNIELLDKLKSDGYKLSLASNAIRDTIDIALVNLGLDGILDPLISNEDIRFPKPFPECYWKCMTYWRSIPMNTLIIEDSYVGIQGARNSGAHVYECIEDKYLDYDIITRYIELL